MRVSEDYKCFIYFGLVVLFHKLNLCGGQIYTIIPIIMWTTSLLWPWIMVHRNFKMASLPNHWNILNRKSLWASQVTISGCTPEWSSLTPVLLNLPPCHSTAGQWWELGRVQNPGFPSGVLAPADHLEGLLEIQVLRSHPGLPNQKL